MYEYPEEMQPVLPIRPIVTSDDELSFLAVRDKYSEVLAWNGNGNPICDNDLTEILPCPNAENITPQQKLEVFLRLNGNITQNDAYNIDPDSTRITCRIPSDCYAVRNTKHSTTVVKTFEFTHIFDHNANQRKLFNGVVRNKCVGLINGNRISILTYGVSGAGKTYTLLGTEEEPGVIPRSLHYLFRTLSHIPQHKATIKLQSSEKLESLTDEQIQDDLLTNERVFQCLENCQHAHTFRNLDVEFDMEPVANAESKYASKDLSFGIWVSFAEIYNEYVYDLLKLSLPHTNMPKCGFTMATARPKLKLASNQRGDQFINNLTLIRVCNSLEAYHILQYGIKNLQFASTHLNAHSSRSHSIYTVYLVQFMNENGVAVKRVVNTMRFFDLAGTERAKKSHNKGTQLQESGNINNSLLVLSRCISKLLQLQRKAISISRQLIPFRESKLTRLLQRALLGEEFITMIISISPCKDLLDETLHTLAFSAIAKQVRLDTAPVHKKPFKQSGTWTTEQQDVVGLKQYILQLEERVSILALEVTNVEENTRNELNQDYHNLLKEDYEARDAQVRKEHREYQMFLDNQFTRFCRKLRNSDVKHQDLWSSHHVDGSSKNGEDNLNASDCYSDEDDASVVTIFDSDS